MAERFVVGGILKEVFPGTECWRYNNLRQYPFVVELFGFGELVSFGLFVMMPAKQGGGSKRFS